jgi:hypothetical protein
MMRSDMLLILIGEFDRKMLLFVPIPTMEWGPGICQLPEHGDEPVWNLVHLCTYTISACSTPRSSRPRES